MKEKEEQKSVNEKTSGSMEKKISNQSEKEGDEKHSQKNTCGKSYMK